MAFREPLARSSVATSAAVERTTSDTAARHISASLATAFALPALILGIGIRLIPAINASFPLNDGGMFYRMIQDLQRSHFALPVYTSYNGGHVPFAYPFLGFYVAAGISSFLHIDALTVLRVLPALVSCLTLLAFYRFAQRVLPPIGTVAATFAFALLPRSFEWEIMGGGLTRSFGFLFAMLALTELYLVFHDGETWRVVSASLLCGLTVLSHLELAWFLAFSAALLVVTFVRSRGAVVQAAIIAVGTIVVSAPWWFTVLLRYGLTPLLAAGQTGGTLSLPDILAAFVRLDLTQESLFSPILILGIVGLLLCLRDRRYLLPIWIAACLILDPRKYLTDVTVPLALLAGIGVEEFLIPLLGRNPIASIQSRVADRSPHVPSAVASASRWLAPTVLTLALTYSLFSAIGSPQIMATLTPLPSSERSAMAWVSANTPTSARFLVISGENWATDRSAEWFPALANRVSVATVQGSEWLPNGGFAAQLKRDTDVQQCAVAGTECLTAWVQTEGTPFDYVYINRQEPVRVIPPALGGDFHWALEYALRADPHYRLVYQDKGAAIFAVVHPAQAATSAPLSAPAVAVTGRPS